MVNYSAIILLELFFSIINIKYFKMRMLKNKYNLLNIFYKFLLYLKKIWWIKKIKYDI